MFVFSILTLVQIILIKNIKECFYDKKLVKDKKVFPVIITSILSFVFYCYFIIFIANDDVKNVMHSKIFEFSFLIYVLHLAFFSYIPKKSREIYDYVFAHRGFHLNIPENSIDAYASTIGKLGIEMDVRLLKDSTLVCYKEEYTKKLLGVPGKISDMTYSKLKKCHYIGTKYKVVTLKEALELIDGKSPILLEIKGKVNMNYITSLDKLISSYNGDIYFSTINIISYIRLKKVYSDKVFWILNPLRKRFNFLKGKHYENEFDSLVDFFYENKLEIPTLEDLTNIFVGAFEENETVNEIVTAISGLCNNYKSRVGEECFLSQSLILHRGILSKKFSEHSKEAFEACVKFARRTNILTTIELDLVYHNSKIICYHSDKISSKLGQEKSCAQKNSVKDALTLEEILDILKNADDNISVIFDFKDSNLKNRILEKEFIRIIEERSFKNSFSVQAWNPLVLMYFEKERPQYIRGQVGHSLSGLVKYVPITKLPWIVNVILFNKSHADYCVYDANQFIYFLIKYNKNIKGRPVFIYAPKTELEIEAFIGKEQIAGFIVENVLDKNAWSREYLLNFKKK